MIPCACEDRTVSGDARLEGLGVPRRFSRTASFDSFDELSSELIAARRAVERWAEAYPDVREGLFLAGPSGVGKTHLAVAALRRVLLERNIDTGVRFVYVPELIEQLRWVARNGETSEDGLLAPLFAAEILVLDGLGEDMVQEWVVEKMLYVLTRRYNDCGILLCTSVYPADHEHGSVAAGADPRGGVVSLVDRISVRGVSMLREACQFVDVRGEDYRDTVIRHGTGL